MFIEKIHPQTIRKFFYSLCAGVDRIQKTPEGYRVRLTKGSLGPQPEYILGDFDCKANEYADLTKAYVEKNWRIYLYFKFGEEYKEALFDHIKKQPKVKTNSTEV